MKEELKNQDLRSSYLPVLNKQLNTVCSAFFFFFFEHIMYELYIVTRSFKSCLPLILQL